jgi:hypothetical protein
VLLVGPLGIEGVAWGTTVPELVTHLFLAVYVCRVLDVRVRTYVRRAFLAPALTTALLAAGWGAVAAWTDLGNWPALLATGTAGLALYLLAGCLLEFGPQALGRWVRAFLPLRPRTATGFTPAAREV